MTWTSCKYFGLLDRFYCTVRISLSISLFFQRKNCHWYKQRYKKLLNTVNQWSSNGPVFRSVNPALFRARNFLGDLCLYSFTWNLFLEIEAKYETIAIISSPANHGQETQNKTENWEHLDFSFLSFPCVFHYQLHLSGFCSRKVNDGRYPAYFSC